MKQSKKKKGGQNTVLLPHPTEKKNKQINNYLRKNSCKGIDGTHQSYPFKPQKPVKQ